MRLAIIGTGNVAKTLTRALIKAHHDVVLGSRDPQHAPPWAAQLAVPVQIQTPAQAARGTELVINATPGAVSVEAFTAIDSSALDGKVLVDVANAVVPRGEGVALVYPNGSLGEELQKALPPVRVVKTLNTMSAGVMTDPGALPAPSSVFLAGDDASAKQTVAALLGDLGWPADSLIDLGGITAAKGPEHAFHLLGALFGALGTPRLNFAIIR
jgi:8-hydroxy-5-deazaflavin:NADPH oxidoreductase